MTPDSTPASSFGRTRSFAAARILAAAAGALLLGQFAVAQTPTLIVVRAMPAKVKRGETFATMTPLEKADIAEVKIGGKTAEVTDIQPVLKGPHNLQLMVLLDSMEQIGINDQFTDIKKFFTDMPPNVEIGVGYLLQGQAKIVQPFTTDRDLAAKALHLQSREEAASPKNDNGNPFSCLRDLAAHWPTPDPNKIRGVLFITDGIIRGNGQQQAGDQLNPDVEGASQSLQRAGIQPYPFFYMDAIIPQGRSEGGPLEGQQNFSQLDADTGGLGLYEGQFAPSSFSPLLNTLYATLQNERILTVTAPGKPGKFATVDIKSAKDDVKVFSPDGVTIGNVLNTKAR